MTLVPTISFSLCAEKRMRNVISSHLKWSCPEWLSELDYGERAEVWDRKDWVNGTPLTTNSARPEGRGFRLGAEALGSNHAQEGRIWNHRLRRGIASWVCLPSRYPDSPEILKRREEGADLTMCSCLIGDICFALKVNPPLSVSKFIIIMNLMNLTTFYI